MDFNDYQEIVRLKSRYFRYIDTKQYDRLMEVFAPEVTFEGLWATAPTPQDFIAALKRNLPEGTVTVHQGYMPDLVELEPGRVRGIWAMYDYLTWPKDTKAYLGETVEGQRGIHGYGHYEEEYVKTDEGWKIVFLRLSRIRIDPIVGDDPVVPNYPFVKLLPDFLD